MKNAISTQIERFVLQFMSGRRFNAFKELQFGCAIHHKKITNYSLKVHTKCLDLKYGASYRRLHYLKQGGYMLPKAEFNPEYQFHVLLNFADDLRSVAVVPSLPGRPSGRFLVVDQGKVLGHLLITEKQACVCYKGNIAPSIVSQLEDEIKGHYYN